MPAQRTLEEARRLLEEAKGSRAVDLHPHARQHQVPIKDIERTLAAGTLAYGKTPEGESERYTMDLELGAGRRLRLVLTLEAEPAYCLVIAAYEKW